MPHQHVLRKKRRTIMKALLRSRPIRLSVLAIGVLCTAVVLAALFDEDTEVEDLFNHDLYASTMAGQVKGIADIAADFEYQQITYLPIVVPNPEYTHVQGGGILAFDPARFPKEFLKGLVSVEESAITKHPITVYEDPKTRERIILNAHNEKIGGQYSPRDYDPQWYVKQQYPGLSEMDPDAARRLIAIYDASRIVITYDLILKEELIQYVWKQSIDAALRAEKDGVGGGGMRLGWEGGPVSNLQFTAIDWETNGTMTVTLAYPTNYSDSAFEIFALDGPCGLIDSWWDPGTITNADTSTNWISWNDTGIVRTYGDVRYYVAAVSNDVDGDGATDGFERYVCHSDPTNSVSKPVPVSGTISYAGTLPGPVHMIASTESNSWTGCTETFPSPGPYTNNRVANGLYYYFNAYRDSNTNKALDVWEARGSYSETSTHVTNALADVDITLIDPPSVWGTVEYSGSQTGAIRVIAATSSNAWSGDYSCLVYPPATNYMIAGMPASDYWIRAFVDSDGDATVDLIEAQGEHAQNPLSVTSRVVGADIVLDDQAYITNVKFNHDTGSATNDALNIRGSRTNAFGVSQGEWIRNTTTNWPVAYTTNLSVTVKVRIEVPADVTNADVWAVSTDGNGSLGSIGVTDCSFASGVSSPEFITFHVTDPTPVCVGKTTTDVWQWKIGNINGASGGEWNLNTTGVHTVYTLFGLPLAPWQNTAGNVSNAWTSALDFVCDAAGCSGSTNPATALAQLTGHLHSELGYVYDGIADFGMDLATNGNFELSNYMKCEPWAKVDCTDQAGALTVLSRLTGLASQYLLIDRFGYIYKTDLVGVGPCNNPFYLHQQLPPEYQVPLLGTNGVTDLVWNNRTVFIRHAFVRYGGMIYDATCATNTGQRALLPHVTNAVDISTSAERYCFELWGILSPDTSTNGIITESEMDAATDPGDVSDFE
jgi:hypothetical protein